MNTRKKPVQEKPLEKREREFNVYVSGANAERVDNLRKKEKYEIAQNRSKSKNTRKKWDVEGDERPKRTDEDDEVHTKNEVAEAQPKRERRGWGVPRPNPVFEDEEENKVENLISPKKDIQEEIPDYSDKSQEVESRGNLEDNQGGRRTTGEEEEEEEENEDIKNFISTMRGEDIEKLRQSVADSLKEDEFRKTLQGLKAEQPQVSNEKPVVRNRQISNEVEEDIVEDIDENPVELDQDYNKSTNKVESSYYAGRPISVRKARPISATYHDVVGSKPIEPVYAGIPFQAKNIDTKYKPESPSFELDYRKTVDHPPAQTKQSTNPFKGPISPTNRRPGMKEKEKEKTEIPSKGPSNIIKTTTKPERESPTLLKSPEERKSEKGANGLLKRIESLDEGKKQLLESILDKIEKGEYGKEILLDLKFLNIKPEIKSPEKEVRRSREQEKPKEQPKEHKREQKDSRDRRDQRDRKHVPTKSELTLPSNVESKITKITRGLDSASPLKNPTPALSNKITDLPKIEPTKAVTTRAEENIPEKISLPKPYEMPKVSTDTSAKSSRTSIQDTLEKQNSFTKRGSNGTNYNSNPEPVHLPGLANKSKNQASSQIKTEPSVYPELRIDSTPGGPIVQEHQLQFRIMSTWGSINQAGLTDIQVFDEDGKKIEVKPSDFHLKNCGLSSIKNINRLVDGVIYTTEDEHMWLCTMPAPPMTAEMFITLKNVKGIGAFRIWNYNKSLIDSIRGIKKLEIIHNKNLVWIGNINRGPGNEFETYHTEIILKQGITLPSVEQPQVILAPAETEQPERPSSDVPIWLQDNWKGGMPPVTSSFESRGSIGTGLSRREHERSASALTSGMGNIGIEASKSLADRVHNPNQGQPELKIESKTNPNLYIPDVGKGIDVQKSASRIKNQPRIEGPTSDILDQNVGLRRRTEEKTPRGGQLANDQKENNNVQSSGKKDDNSSINSVEFFNITNFGRLRPAKRESLQQVFNLQQDVIEKVRDVQKRLDFKTTPITEEMDILTQFDKGGADQPKLKIPQQSVEQASANLGLGKKKEEPTGLTRKTPSIQQPSSKNVPDALDSMIHKGSVTAKNANSVEMETPAVTKKIEKILYDNKSFRIPELPRGRVVKICIYSTWGDAHYVGLNGIELFDDRGEAIALQDVASQIKANPPDINCLPGYGKDPRTIDKIVDGTYLTCDDLHVWLAPFTQGRENTIEIDLRESRTISMIRIWNYNKSRIHSYRGARDIAIKLDDSPIFLGEITKAPGSLKGAEDSCEYILFTENDNILSKIENRDWLNRIPKNEIVKPDLNSTIERPMTGTRQFDENDLRDIKDAFNQPLLGPDGRPVTMARINVNNQIREQIEKNKKELKRLEQQEKLRQEKEKANISKALSIISSSSAQYAEIKCKSLVITITKSWGDSFYVGLTGLEIYDGEGNKIILSMKNLNAKPKDMNSIPGYSGDHRTLDKLINHDNLTIKDENMWLIPFTPNQNHYIYINFEEAKTVSGIKFWNYNKGEDGSYRGVKNINISADGIMLTPPSGVLIRKAPGNDYHDFSQFVPVPFFDGWDEETVKLYKNLRPQPMSGFLTQEYDTPEFPTGFCFKLKLLSTWGDFNYVGLNGLEFYDQKGEIVLTKNQKDYKLSAEPSSVDCLTGHENDIRTIDKLVNGTNNTCDDRNMWLAPLLVDRRDEGVFKVDHNEIIITFDKPRIISCIKFWNYSKTPSRGVREVEIFCDDLVIYRGYLRIAQSEMESKGNQQGLITTVLFTKSQDIIQKVDANIYTEDGKPQKVTLYNEKKVINPVNESRPQTHATMERPTTSVKGLMPY